MLRAEIVRYLATIKGKNDALLYPLCRKTASLLLSKTHLALSWKNDLGKNVSTMRQPAAQTAGQSGTSAGRRILRGRKKGRHAVASKLPGALARALLVIILIILPSTFMPSAGGDSALVVMLIALFAGFFTAAEYSVRSPSLVEFRDAPPFNRIRFGALFISVYTLCLILNTDASQSTLSMLFNVVGDQIGRAVDFPYSPVRLVLVMMPDDTPQHILDDLRTAAGVCYVISCLSLALFVIILRRRAWPRRTQSFNFWINLPTFDPTAGGDVVDRLNRDSTVNLILGFLLPFMIPAGIKAASALMGPIRFDDPQTLIWTVAIWAFLPASLLMRGVALSRVAGMIHVQRKKAYAAAAAEGMLPV